MGPRLHDSCEKPSNVMFRRFTCTAIVNSKAITRHHTHLNYHCPNLWAQFTNLAHKSVARCPQPSSSTQHSTATRQLNDQAIKTTKQHPATTTHRHQKLPLLMCEYKYRYYKCGHPEKYKIYIKQCRGTCTGETHRSEYDDQHNKCSHCVTTWDGGYVYKKKKNR